jgi:hypothetical protein
VFSVRIKTIRTENAVTVKNKDDVVFSKGRRSRTHGFSVSAQSAIRADG